MRQSSSGYMYSCVCVGTCPCLLIASASKRKGESYTLVLTFTANIRCSIGIRAGAVMHSRSDEPIAWLAIEVYGITVAETVTKMTSAILRCGRNGTALWCCSGAGSWRRGQHKTKAKVWMEVLQLPVVPGTEKLRHEASAEKEKSACCTSFSCQLQQTKCPFSSSHATVMVQEEHTSGLESMIVVMLFIIVLH